MPRPRASPRRHSRQQYRLVDAITEAIAKLPAAEASKLPAAETSMLPDAEALAPPPVASTPHADAPNSRDADADKINEVIKKLAADITQGQALLGTRIGRRRRQRRRPASRDVGGASCHRRGGRAAA